MTEEETMTSEELASAMDGMADFYRFASNMLLHEFTKDQIAELKSMGVPENADPEAATQFAAIKRYLSHCGADPRTDMAVDYARIFLSAGVYDGLTAEPYESVFTSEDNLLMQEARDEVVAIYRSQGVSVDPELHMPEDHLGLELDFVSTMAGRIAQAIREADEKSIGYEYASELVGVQRDFMEKHILNWIDMLIEKVDEFAALPIYPALMRIVRIQVQQDCAFLGEVSKATM